MAAQPFDDMIAFSGAELAARLDPQSFEAFAAATLKRNPAQAWIIENRRERWLGK